MEHNQFQPQKKGWFIPGLIGMILGIVLVLSLIGLLPGKQNEKAVPASFTETAHADDDNRESEVTAAVKKSKDAVVSVVNYKGGNFQNGAAPSKAGSGSGVIYKKEGSKALVVTNHHVVAGASELEVTLSNGTKLAAKLLGSDPLTDLAVLSVDGAEVEKVIEIGDSKNLKPGASAIAIGNPLGFLQGTVTKGVISASERAMPMDIDENGVVDWESEVIQTDASINPGNSGGALIDINGQLIGINSAKISQDAVEGIGFAIPIHAALPVMKSLEKYGEVRRPFIGIGPVSLQDIPSQYWGEDLNLPEDVKSGIVVMEVSPDSPAEEAGLRKYDVITAINGKRIKSVIDLRRFLFKDAEERDSLEVTFYRDGQKETVSITPVVRGTGK